MSLSHDPPDGGKKPIRPPLRLVHPAPTPALRERTRYRKAPVFSPEESARLRAALKTARSKYGTWARLADALTINRSQLNGIAAGRYVVSATVAVRLSRVLAVPLESLFRAPTDASTCAACGARRTP